MTSRRHRESIARIASDGHRLTRRERLALGLAPDFRAARRPAPEAPPFPADAPSRVWHLLLVRSGREVAVAALLRELGPQLGLVAFCPVEQVMQRGNRYVRHKRQLRQRPLLAGLVALGVQGLVPWGLICGPEGVRLPELGDVLGVLSRDGVPARLRLDALLWMRDRDRRRGHSRDFAPVVGGEATIAVGPYAGLRCTVVALEGGQARLRVIGDGVFSGRVAAQVPETWLEEVS